MTEMKAYKVYCMMTGARPYVIGYYLKKETAEEVAKGIKEIYDYHGEGRVEEIEIEERQGEHIKNINERLRDSKSERALLPRRPMRGLKRRTPLLRR